MKRKRKICSSDLHCFNQDDHISLLPDDILLLILSSLTVKEATITSILSRRWRYLCASLSRLDFDDSILKKPHYVKPDKNMSGLSSLVRKVLRSYKGHYLEEFRLRIGLSEKHTCLVNWCVNFALSKKVQKLELDFNYPCGSLNPEENYTFEVGEYNQAVHHLRRGPSLISWSLNGFNYLKSLCFKSVGMGRDVLDGLLSKCPVLEMLTLHNVSELGHLKVVGPSLKLKHLEIVSCHQLNEIEIYDVPLISMKRWWSGEAAIKMDKVPCLVELSISTFLDTIDEFPLFSSCLSQLESLKLCLIIYGDEVMQLDVLCLLSRLSVLRELELTCYLHHDLLLLVPLIVAPPHLNKIVVRVISRKPVVKRGRSLKLKEVASSVGVLEHLKLLVCAGYSGRTSEDEFISCITKNAKALETIVIDSNYQNEHLVDGFCQDNKVREDEVYVRRNAKEWLEGIVPPRINLVIR